MLWRYNVFVTILLRPLAWMTRAPGWLAHNIKPGAGRREVRRLEHGWPRVARVRRTTPLAAGHAHLLLSPTPGGAVPPAYGEATEKPL